jgi:phosphate transport system protein
MNVRQGYDDELVMVRTRLALMGASARQMLTLACQAVATADADLAWTVIEQDSAINQMERESDEACLSMLARRQPVARDLRFIVSALKVVTDFERIGDLAVNIAEHAGIATVSSPGFVGSELFSTMASGVLDMVAGAIHAFFSDDVGAARAIIVRDGEIDDAWIETADALSRQMQGDPSFIAAALRFRSIAKCLERCADHATNIAELTIFKVHGDDVRHTGASALVSQPPRW